MGQGTPPSRKTQFLVNLTAQATGKIYSIFASLCGFILIARWMGPEALGTFSYALTFYSVWIAVADFGTSSILARELAQDDSSALEFWGDFLVLRLILCLLAALGALLSAYLIRPDLFSALLIGILATPFLSSRFFDALFQIYNRPWFSTVPSLIYGTAYLGFIAASVFLVSTLNSLINGYVAANILYGVVAFVLSTKLLKVRIKFRAPQLVEIFKKSWPIGIASLITLVNTRADIFMLAHFKSDYEVGIYNSGFRLLDAGAILMIIVMTPILPIFAKDAVRDRISLKKNASDLIECLTILSFPLALTTPYFSEPLIQMMFGTNFLAAAEVVNILVWVGVLLCFSIFSMNMCIALGVVHFGWWNAALATTVNITLNLLWIPKYSYLGSAWATLVSEVLLVTISFYYITKHLGNVFRLGRWCCFGLLGLVLHLCLVMTAANFGRWGILPSLMLYFVALFLLEILPINILKTGMVQLKQKVAG